MMRCQVNNEACTAGRVGSLIKIKTIGDAYLVVGGLPVPKSNHVEAIAELALGIREVIDQFNEENDLGLSMRIGINTGPVVAGIIGEKKFIYDLWGDTVNTASRMESLGQPGTIQVTEMVYQRLRDTYSFDKRGSIEVKGRGTMETFMMTGRKL